MAKTPCHSPLTWNCSCNVRGGERGEGGRRPRDGEVNDDGALDTSRSHLDRGASRCICECNGIRREDGARCGGEHAHGDGEPEAGDGETEAGERESEDLAC